jgi:hypothetical protein
MHSSGVNAKTFDLHLAHECGWEGLSLWVFDPEVDRDTIATTCEGCGGFVEEPLGGSW